MMPYVLLYYTEYGIVYGIRFKGLHACGREKTSPFMFGRLVHLAGLKARQYTTLTIRFTKCRVGSS